MNSRLYVGRLMHARLNPLRHAFKYPIYMLAVDLAELPMLDREVTLFGYNRLRPISLWDEDYLDRGGGSIHDKLMRFLERRGCADGISSTRLVTMGKCFNHAFNPVSFYYCCRADGSLRCAVAEVNNSYGERHLYILDEACSPLPPRPGFIARYTTPKEFFVSPFNDLSGEYDFHFGPLDEAMDIKLDLVRDGRLVYQSRVRGRSRPFEDGALLRTLMRYPLSVALVLPRITWQALVVRRRGLRALMKPNPTSPMTIRTKRTKAAKPRSGALGRSLARRAPGARAPLTPIDAPGTKPLTAAERLERRIARATIVMPFAGLGVAALLLWKAGILHAVDIWLCTVMYFATCLGVTAGFHRHFTHRSFEAGRAVQIALGVLGSMAAQGPLLFWVAAHRRHHQHSDAPSDPHSPRPGAPGAWAALRGLWHAHVGWMLAHEPEDWIKYAPDVLRSRAAFWLSRYYAVWVLLGLVAPGLVGGLVTQSWTGALSGAIWGGLVRMFLVHHATWAVNSICHSLGARPYETQDLSTNNGWCAAITLGEGWHNNHHAFPSSARHGLEWWQIDMTYWVIRALEVAGAARAVKVPSPGQRQQRSGERAKPSSAREGKSP